MLKDFFKKFLLFGLVFITVLAVIAVFKNKGGIYEDIKGLLGNGVTENINENEIAPLKSVKEIKSTTVEGINVPYYWKSGINTTEKDYLKGYVPTLSDFQNFYATTLSVLYSKKITVTSEKGENVLPNASSFTLVKGIAYDGDFLKWDSSDCVKQNGYFVCPNWINWTGIPIADKYYVITECKINGESGKCVFEDYAKEYYTLQRATENRCYGSDSNYFCNVNDYLKVLQSN